MRGREKKESDVGLCRPQSAKQRLRCSLRCFTNVASGSPWEHFYRFDSWLDLYRMPKPGREVGK